MPGSELAGFGNLVLIRHPGGWVTAYAHSETVLVKEGDLVKQGQPIATAGLDRQCGVAAGPFRATQGQGAGRSRPHLPPCKGERAFRRRGGRRARRVAKTPHISAHCQGGPLPI